MSDNTDEFDAEFARLASPDASAPAPAGDDAAQGAEPVKSEDQQPSPDASAPAPAGDDAAQGAEPVKSEDQQPAPAEQAPAGTEIAPADAAAPAGGTASEDIWATADPALKAAYDAAVQGRQSAEHRFASVNGRVAALNRQLQETRQAVGGRQQTETPKGLDQVLESEQIKGFQTEYPEVAGPILEIIRTQQAAIDRLSKPVEQVQQDQQMAFYESQADILARDHPDWTDFTAHDKFGPWLDTQPRHVREAAERNSQFITDASEVSDVLTRFKQHIGAGAAPTPAPVQDPAPQPDARRQKQLEAGADVRTKGPQPTSAVPDAFEDAFAHFAQKGGRAR